MNMNMTIIDVTVIIIISPMCVVNESTLKWNSPPAEQKLKRNGILITEQFLVFGANRSQ